MEKDQHLPALLGLWCLKIQKCLGDSIGLLKLIFIINIICLLSYLLEVRPYLGYATTMQGLQ